MRIARDQYLQHFGKIGTGDPVLLQQEIEKEQEAIQKGGDPSSGTKGLDLVVGSTGPAEERMDSPLVIGAALGVGENEADKMIGVEEEKDIKAVAVEEKTDASDTHEDLKMES